MKIFDQLLNSTHPYLSEGNQKLFYSSSFPFLLEDKWEFTSNFKKATLIPVILDANPDDLKDVLEQITPDQYILILGIYHIDDYMDKKFFKSTIEKFKKYTNNVLLVHKNLNLAYETDDNIIYYDCMFNRHKVYYTEYERVAKIPDALWTRYASKESFSIPVSKKMPYRFNKKFLSTNLVYKGLHNSRMRYRAALHDFLEYNKLTEHGFISSPANRFYSNNPSVMQIHDINYGGGFWYPVADSYYEQSFISVYVETLTQSYHKVKCVTEKTFDPLIKGNFVWPFSYPGIIKDLKNFYNFKLPKEISYNYDDEIDNDIRFNKYVYGLKQLLNNSLNDLNKIYIKNKSILDHNRLVFFNRPYDKLYSKVLNKLN